MRLLVIEDNLHLAVAIEQGLAEQGFTVDVSRSGHDGEELAAIESYDVIILDLMLPDHDGVRLCQNLRRRGVATPVLIVTALADTRDKVIGLNAGADDYLTKPFDFDELIARVRALMRRGGQDSAARLEYEDITMDLIQHRVERAGKPIELTRKEFSLLEYFLRNPHRLLTRAAIGEHVWDMNFDPFSNVIDVYVSMLRRKIDKPYEHALIHTIIGMGYYFGLRAPNEPES
ncbi:response regulator [Phycisphaerales bacterium AB-hyl4]|uniref:Response regulator n=1 Tax=Natronomicrosphaera hydrolytica TaxID=3242702 RepID=A0ABV4U465_9BACT